MPDTDNTQNSPRRKKKNRDSTKSSLLITIILLLIIVIGAAIFFLNGSRETEQILPPPESLQEQQPDSITVSPLEPPVSQTEDLDRTDSSVIEEKEQIEEPGIPGPVTSTQQESKQSQKEKECQVLGNKLYNFFIHIDSEEYIKLFNLQVPAKEHFTGLAKKLLDNPPVVSRESDDLYTILKNMAHFFRIIGKDNIILVKTILDRERDKIEDVASELYQWITLGDCRHKHFEFDASLEEVYEYAGFFLNTMGGRSYLFRRDSRSRLLVNYYSILIVASANEKGLNRHGIDISPLLPQLVQEIEATNQLIYKENYLDQLYSLMEKYQ